MTRHFAILTRIFILSTESRTQKVVQISTHTKAWISILQHTELLSSQCRKLSHARRVPPSRQGFQGREEGHFALPHYLSLAMDVSSKTHRSFFFLGHFGPQIPNTLSASRPAGPWHLAGKIEVFGVPFPPSLPLLPRGQAPLSYLDRTAPSSVSPDYRR